jgi:hypothetical protein
MLADEKRRTIALSGVPTGFFIVMLDTTIVNVACRTWVPTWGRVCRVCNGWSMPTRWCSPRCC